MYILYYYVKLNLDYSICSTILRLSYLLYFIHIPKRYKNLFLRKNKDNVMFVRQN